MVGMGLDLGAEVVATGVESADEVAALLDCGVRYLQGNHIAEPALESAVMSVDIAFPNAA